VLDTLRLRFCRILRCEAWYHPTLFGGFVVLGTSFLVNLLAVVFFGYDFDPPHGLVYFAFPVGMLNEILEILRLSRFDAIALGVFFLGCLLFDFVVGVLVGLLLTPVVSLSGSPRVRLGLPAAAGIACWIVLNFGLRFGPL